LRSPAPAPTPPDADAVRAAHVAQTAAAAYDALLDDLHARFDNRGFHDAAATFALPLSRARQAAVDGAAARNAGGLLGVLQNEHNALLRRELDERYAEVVALHGNGDAASALARLTALADTLNNEQRALYDAVVGAVQRGAAFAGALIGSAGTGKTFVVALAVDRLRFERRVVLCVASTGVASRMYRGGSTAHSAFGIAVDKPPYDRSKPLACSLDASRAQQRYALALGAELIVWDEAYAIDNRSVDAVHRLLCDAAQLDADAADCAPFGGMRALLIGDPRQIPPVVVGTTAENAVAQASLQAWRRYGALRKFVLRAAVRQADDAAYAAFCAAVGNGTIGVGLGVGSLLSHRRVDVPPTIAHLRGDANADAFQRRVFADAALAACVTPGGVDGDAIRAISRRAIICARVVDVHRWNERVTARLPGNLEHCYSHTQVVIGSDPGERRNASLVVDDDGEHVLQLRRTRGVDAAADDERHNAALYDYLRTFNVSGVPPHDLPLKAGMVLILIRNLAPQDGLTNGTKLVLLRIVSDTKLLVVRAFAPDGTLLPDEHLLPRLWFDFYLPKTLVRVRRRQFPVVVGYAFTCHRAQCQTLDFVGLDATVDVFAHGALFVSLSRVRRAADLCVFVGGDDQVARAADNDQPLKLLNVVYQSLLADIHQ
jgi:ATP-dependent DNA helicase PIF1